MAPVTTYANASTQTITLSKADVADGQTLFALCVWRTIGGTKTPASGWTEIGVSATDYLDVHVYYKQIPSAAGETSTSYAFSTTAAAERGLGIMWAESCAASSPFDGTASLTRQTNVSSVAMPTVTTTGARDDLIVVTYSTNAANSTACTANTPTGMTLLQELDSANVANTLNMAVQVFRQTLTSSGATGTRTSTFAGGNTVAAGAGGVVFSLLPSVASPTASAAITLGATGTASSIPQASGTGVLSLTASGTAAYAPPTGTAGLSLVASGTPSVGITATAPLTLGATGSAFSTGSTIGSATVTLGASGTPSARATATAALDLEASATSAAVNTYSSASSTTITLLKPANLGDGQMLFAACLWRNPGGTKTLPSSWAEIPSSATDYVDLHLYYKSVPSAAAETAVSYDFVSSATVDRAMGMIWVETANGTPVDVSTSQIRLQNVSSVAMPSVSPTGATDPMLVLAYSSNAAGSTAIVPSLPSGMSQLGQVSHANTGATLNMALTVFRQVLTAAGSTGTRTSTFSGGGTVASGTGGLVVALTPATGTATATASLDLAATGATSGAIAATGTGSLTLGASGGAKVPIAISTASLSLVAGQTTPILAWMARSRWYVAHRGGSADWVEETLFAYAHSAAWSSTLALEISVWKSSDGVWVCSHDQTTGRVFGTNYDIPSTPWATLQPLTTTSGGFPMSQLTDVLDLYAAGSRVIMVDNKGTQTMSAHLDLLDTYGGNTRFIIKGTGISDLTKADAATARGYQTWGYFYDADVSSGNMVATQSHWSILGMDYTGTTGDWTAATGIGKPVLAHIVPTLSGANTSFGRGAKGIMASGVMEIVPAEIAPATASLTLGASGSVKARLAATAAVDLEAVASSGPVPATGAADVELFAAGSVLAPTHATAALALTLAITSPHAVLRATAVLALLATAAHAGTPTTGTASLTLGARGPTIAPPGHAVLVLAAHVTRISGAPHGTAALTLTLTVHPLHVPARGTAVLALSAALVHPVSVKTKGTARLALTATGHVSGRARLKVNATLSLVARMAIARAHLLAMAHLVLLAKGSARPTHNPAVLGVMVGGRLQTAYVLGVVQSGAVVRARLLDLT